MDLWDHHTEKFHLVGIDEGILESITKPKSFIENQYVGTSIGIIKGSSSRTDWDAFLVGQVTQKGCNITYLACEVDGNEF